MHKLRRNERGAAIVEFQLMLPILLFFLALVAPLVVYGYDYMILQRSAAHGVRFASRADVNVRCADELCSSYTRRPSPSEVASFVSDASGNKVGPETVTVTPDPRLTLPGERIAVDIGYTVSYGPLADIANTVKSLFFGGGEFLPPSEITVSAWGREE